MNEHDEVVNIVADKMEEFIRNKFTMNKLTDSEIVKALECLAYHKECPENEECQYYMDNRNICDNVSLAKDALNLINSQKAEKQAMLDYIRCLEEENKKQKAEVERLQKIIVGFMDEVGTWSNKYDVDISNIYKLPILAKEDFNIRNKIKSEARKEFWEKLKQKFQSIKYFPPSACITGDKILKEMEEKMK